MKNKKFYPQPAGQTKKQILESIGFELENWWEGSKEGNDINDQVVEGWQMKLKISDKFCQSYINGIQEILEENLGEDYFDDLTQDLFDRLMKQFPNIAKQVNKLLSI